MLRRKLVRRSSRSVRTRARSSGFSIMELLVVLGVIGIVAGVGLPALLNQLSRVKLMGAAQNVVNLMNQARQRAIKGAENEGPDQEKKPHSVEVVGDEVHILRIMEESPLVTQTAFIHQFTDLEAYIYTLDSSVCENEPLIFNTRGSAETIGRVCLFDGGENIIEIGLVTLGGQPKIRKYLKAADSPTGTAGPFERPSAATANKTWTWY